MSLAQTSCAAHSLEVIGNEGTYQSDHPCRVQLPDQLVSDVTDHIFTDATQLLGQREFVDLWVNYQVSGQLFRVTDDGFEIHVSHLVQYLENNKINCFKIHLLVLIIILRFIVQYTCKLDSGTNCIMYNTTN